MAGTGTGDGAGAAASAHTSLGFAPGATRLRNVSLCSCGWVSRPQTAELATRAMAQHLLDEGG